MDLWVGIDEGYDALTLIHFSLQFCVQSDHHFMVFSICAARAFVSSSSLWRKVSRAIQSVVGPPPAPLDTLFSICWWCMLSWCCCCWRDGPPGAMFWDILVQFMCPGNGKESYMNIQEIIMDIFGIKDALICCLQDGHTLCFSTIRIKGRRFIIKKTNGMGCFMNHWNWGNIADHTVILLSLAHVLINSIHTILKHLPCVSWLQLHFFLTRRHLFTWTADFFASTHFRQI